MLGKKEQITDRLMERKTYRRRDIPWLKSSYAIKNSSIQKNTSLLMSTINVYKGFRANKPLYKQT